MSCYSPPLTLTPAVSRLVAEISERLGPLASVAETLLSPQLRRGNRIRTIQASLAIENNSLSLEQVTAIVDGKRVLGLPREIQEVRNALKAYEQLVHWRADSLEDLLAAHRLLMLGLQDDAGQFRSGGVGIYRGDTLVHRAPPANRVDTLMRNLLQWIVASEHHPLISSSVFHYEFEFIHPFSDGNGRMGRLWQTLILSGWKPELAYLPVETVIRDQQQAYYKALARSDSDVDAAAFVEFMLEALLAAVDEVLETGQVSDQVSDRVKRLLIAWRDDVALSSAELMQRLQLKHKSTFRNNYLKPALAAKLIEMTEPDTPRSPSQKYRLTERGKKNRLT